MFVCVRMRVRVRVRVRVRMRVRACPAVLMLHVQKLVRGVTASTSGESRPLARLVLGPNFVQQRLVLLLNLQQVGGQSDRIACNQSTQ